MKDGFVFCGEIVADDTDEIYVREKAGGNGEIRRSTANDAVNFSVRAFDGVECDGTYDK